MKKATITKTLSFIAIVLLLGAGCGGIADQTMQNTATSESPGTLTFTLKDPEKGLLSGTFENEGYTILFDVARGEENPLSERLAAGAPSHAIDIRICDEKHFCFAQQAGGHAFADTSWVADNSESNGPDDTRARKNFETMKSLHQKLLKIDQGDFKGLTEELQSLIDASRDPNEIILEDHADTFKTPQKGVLTFMSATASGTYTHKHVMKSIGIFFGSVFGDHSASYIQVITSSGTLFSTYWTCNHGSCGNSSSMYNYCVRNYTGRSSTIPINTQCVASISPGTMHPTGYDGCCSTQYNLVGISHVCNDDTRLQRDFMIANAPMSTPYCGDTTLAQYAPSCI